MTPIRRINKATEPPADSIATMESGDAEERRPLLPAENSLRSGFMVNGPTTQNIRDVHFNNGQVKTEQRPATLKESLFFTEMASRERNVADTHRRTGRWFLRTNQYLEWEPGDKPTSRSRRCCGMLPALTGLRRERWQSRLLWVKGNAGAGKSTLMKMAVEHSKRTHKDALILPHFFNARGTGLERSVEGMYRTLISWLLEQLPEELESVLPAPRGRQLTITRWEVPELIRLLRKAVEHVAGRCVLFFIDALDECDRKQVGDMLDVFRSLVEDAWESGRDVRVCFASRPYPHHTFQHATYLDLGEQEEHKKDIAEYIRDCLHDGIPEPIHKKVLEKAAGVFMWTVLVVRMLNEKHDEGDAGGMEALVSSIPGGLYELYSHILERHPGNNEEMLECFRSLLFDHSMFSPDDLWRAIQFCLGKTDDEIRQGYDSTDMAGMKRYIVHVGKGLVEFKGSKYSEDAQFIHESAREFILHKGGEILRMYGVQNRDDLAAQSHVRLRDYYFNEVMARRPQLLEVVKTEGRDGITMDALDRIGWTKFGATRLQFPMAFDAAVLMVQHAERAQRCGVDQTEFVNMVLPHAGPFLLFFFVTDSGVLGLDSVIGLLVAANCPQLILHTQREPARRAIQSRQPFGLIDEGSRISPVLIALTDNSRAESVDALLELCLESEPRHPQLQRLLQHLVHNHHRYGPGFPFARVVPQFGPFLDLIRAGPAVATFFLIALAPPEILEPHFHALQCIVDREPCRRFPRLLFSQILLLFIQAQLNSTAIDLMHPDTMRWLVELESDEEESDEEESDEEESDEEESDEEESDEEESDEEESDEEEREIRQRIVAELRTRREDTHHDHSTTEPQH